MLRETPRDSSRHQETPESSGTIPGDSRKLREPPESSGNAPGVFRRLLDTLGSYRQRLEASGLQQFWRSLGEKFLVQCFEKGPEETIFL